MKPKSTWSGTHVLLGVVLALMLGACKPPVEEGGAKTKQPPAHAQSIRAPVVPGVVVNAQPPDVAVMVEPVVEGRSKGQVSEPPAAATPSNLAERVLRPTFLPPRAPEPPPSPAGSQSPPARAGQLDLTQAEKRFADEFDAFDWDEAFYGAGLRSGRWRTSYMNGDDPNARDNRTLPGNGEMQVYMDRSFPHNGRGSLGLHPFQILDGGVLRITANPTAPRVRSRVWGRRYTSGAITSWGSFSQRYGVFQIRARLPKGKGLWPAFWLLNQAGGWPPEVDVFEVLGQTPTSLFTAVHTKSSGRHVGTGETTTVADMTDDFHVYSVDWGPQVVIFYFDGEEVWRHPTPRDMHKPMFLIVNLAVGGHWPGPPNAETVFPANLDVDWVRVWQRPAYASLP